jgi:hypothetical protein
MKRFGLKIFIILFSLFASADAFAQHFTPDSVVEIVYGPNYIVGYGPDNPYFPVNILGVPDTSATPFAPSYLPEKLQSLGSGGHITLKFNPPIVNGVGVDFTVFGNPFYIAADTTRTYNKVGIVAVSKDGVTFLTFPYTDTLISSIPLRYAYTGLAGVTPTNGAANPRDAGSPLQGHSGGDSFDLATVGLDTAYYVRITDAGTLVPDFGDSFNLDAVVAIHQAASLDIRDTQWKVQTFRIEQNYPNPFNPSTTINYALPQAGSVTLKVYDVLGREVATLVNEKKAAGSYSVAFNASRLSSGTYIYRLTANGFSQTKKMILAK